MRTHPRRGRRATAALAATLAAAALAGCASGGVRGMCRDWVPMSGPEEWAASATLVVEADVAATDRTVDLVGVYDVREARITRVVQGEAPGDVIDVIATSDRCTISGEPVEYGREPDPLAADGPYRLYLQLEEGSDDVWRLVVPFTVEPLTA